MPHDDSHNPFAAPQVDSVPLPVLDANDPSDFILQDDIVICGPFFVLPQICWKSGATQDLQKVQIRIEQASFRFNSRPIEVVGYVSKSQRQKDFRRGIRLGLLLLAGLALFTTPVITGPPGGGRFFQPATAALLVMTGIVLICTSAVLLATDRPVVRRWRRPNLHYVHGLPPSLLTQLRTLAADRRAPPVTAARSPAH